MIFKINMKEIRTIDSIQLEHRAHTTIHKDQVEFPSGNVGEYLYVERDTSVAIIPLIEEQDGSFSTILVRQFRYPIKQTVSQFPMGFLNHGAATRQQAEDELEEETGFRSNKLTKIGEYFHDPGLNTQKTVVFIAKDLVETAQRLDETEDIEVEKVPVSELSKMIKSGAIADALTIALVYNLEQYLKTTQ
jgi:ADP-ribose pyrophosphatase